LLYLASGRRTISVVGASDSFRENSSSRLLVQWTDFDLGIFCTHRLGSGRLSFFPNTTCRASQTEPKSGRLLFFPPSLFGDISPPSQVQRLLFPWVGSICLYCSCIIKGKFYPWYSCHLAREFIHLNVNNCNMKHYQMVFHRKYFSY
jgi:hypothetical protein